MSKQKKEFLANANMKKARNVTYKEGWVAFEQGLRMEDNPFIPDSPLSAEWSRVWIDGYNEAKMWYAHNPYPFWRLILDKFKYIVRWNYPVIIACIIIWLLFVTFKSATWHFISIVLNWFRGI